MAGDPREQLRHERGRAPATAREPPPEAAGADADGWALLEGLRRRLDDQGTAQRKTGAQVAQLAESIAALVEMQRRRTRRLNLNSFIAYVIFTVLCAAGCVLLYRSRARELIAARDQAVSERDTAVRRADDATTAATSRADAEARAWEVYQLLVAGKRTAATGKLAALRDQPLSRVERSALSSARSESQVMEADAALKAAIAATRAGRFAEVIDPLRAVLDRRACRAARGARCTITSASRSRRATRSTARSLSCRRR